jgi:hypothetical protein
MVNLSANLVFYAVSGFYFILYDTTLLRAQLYLSIII